MLSFILAVIGWFFGEFVIGGILFAIFGGNNTSPNARQDFTYTWIGRIIGLFLGVMIGSSI